jgi:hypothetical protein
MISRSLLPNEPAGSNLAEESKEEALLVQQRQIHHQQELVTSLIEEDSSSDEEVKVHIRPFDDLLPVELMLEVFSHLLPRDLVNIRAVSRNWKLLADDEKVSSPFIMGML